MSTFVDPATGSSDDAQPYRFLDTLSYVRVSGASTDGRRSVVEMRLREGHAPPMHVHEDADETIHVLDGTVAVHTPEGSRSVAAGGSAVLPRGEPHSLRAEERSTVLVATSPAGFEEFVTAVGEPADDAVVPTTPPTEEAIGRVSELAGEHGIEIVGPPPA